MKAGSLRTKWRSLVVATVIRRMTLPVRNAPLPN